MNLFVVVVVSLSWIEELFAFGFYDDVGIGPLWPLGLGGVDLVSSRSINRELLDSLRDLDPLQALL